MPTDCTSNLLEFARVETRKVLATFDGGAITTDAGALLLGAAERPSGRVSGSSARRGGSCLRPWDHV